MSSSVPLRYTQNFLRDSRLVERLLARSSVTAEDTVLEIGPGAGIITDALARRCRQVIAIELDGSLAQRLQRRYLAQRHVTIHAGDFLEYPAPEQPYKVFANIPFACTHDIVTRLTSAAHPPEDAYLIMQREAAEKFCGLPREYLYSVLLKPWFSAEIIHTFQRSDFAPAPSVDVVLLRLKKRGPPLITPRERRLFRDFVVYGFVTRQPTLDAILRGLLTHRQRRQSMKLCAIDPGATPSSITFSQWLQLFSYVARVGGDQARSTLSGSERRLRQRQAQLHKTHRTRTASGLWRA